MSIAVLPAVHRPRALRATTPGRMLIALAVVAVSAIAASGIALVVLGHIRAAVQTIGYDAEPSVVAAQSLKMQLAAMDADAVTDALTDSRGSGTSQSFRAHLAAVDATLVAASRNITYGEAEARPIRDLIESLESYLGSLAETRWMAADTPWLAVQRAKWSSRLMNDFVMPPATLLEQANLRPLERQYDAYRSSALVFGSLAFAGFVVFLAALIGTQIYLLRRTRRLLNIPLAAATLLTAVAMAGFIGAMVAEQADTRAAKEDAFDSIHALYGAKVVANTLRAERALWLLDPATRAGTAAKFTASLHALLAIDPADVKATGAMVDLLSHALEVERAGRPADAIAATPKLGGLLGDELSNVTFGVAEREPATNAVVNLLNYLEVDREIVRLEDTRRHVEAVALVTSAKAGGGEAAFAALDDALDRTIDINNSAFAARTLDAVALLGWLPWATCAALAAAVLLAAGGVWQRWREYR